MKRCEHCGIADKSLAEIACRWTGSRGRPPCADDILVREKRRDFVAAFLALVVASSLIGALIVIFMSIRPHL